MVVTRLLRAILEGVCMGLGFIAIIHIGFWLGALVDKPNAGRFTITIDCASNVSKCWKETDATGSDVIITIPVHARKP